MVKNNRKLETYVRLCPHCQEWKETKSQNMQKCKDCQDKDASDRFTKNRNGRNTMEKKYSRSQINKMREKLGWTPLEDKPSTE